MHSRWRCADSSHEEGYLGTVVSPYHREQVYANGVSQLRYDDDPRTSREPSSQVRTHHHLPPDPGRRRRPL